MMNYSNKKILILGAGASGIGAAHVVAQLGAQVILDDYQPIEVDSSVQAMLDEAGVTIITGSQDISLLHGVDRIIVSPGISLEIPIVKAAKEQHIEVVGEVELAYDISKAPILGITGTNGKTTTTTLLAQVMKGTGLPILVGGNIGDSLSEMAYNSEGDGYLIGELSSYQLESIKDFKAKGVIVLNVTPDHLARHKTMENYVAAKENIFLNQSNEDFLVLNLDDPIVADMAHRASSHILWISQQQAVGNGAYYKDGTCYAVRNNEAIPVITVQNIHIPGAHNIENILAVIALTYSLGVAPEVIYEGIATFTGVEHRLERLDTIDGVTYYNDSKATNVDSAVKALESFDKPVILLAGGHDKMTDLSDFMELVRVKTKQVIFMGEARSRFTEEAMKQGVSNIHQAQSMKEAVQLGKQLATAGDIVLLSPACASYDWYSCFEERGEDFKREVHALKGGAL